MCHANSENSNVCPYLFRICFIYGTNVSFDRGVESLCRFVDSKQDAFWFTNKQVQVKILSILKLVSFERYAIIGSHRISLLGMLKQRKLYKYECFFSLLNVAPLSKKRIKLWWTFCHNCFNFTKLWRELHHSAMKRNKRKKPQSLAVMIFFVY